MSQAFTGTLALTWVAISRDRIQLPVWILAVAAFMVAVVSIWNGDLSQEELVSVAQFYGVQPAVRMFGLASGATLGAYIMSRGFVVFAVLVAVMSILFVVRHTRQDEDTGRAELIGSASVGRHANLASAFIVVVGANVLLAVLIGLILTFKGLPVASSFAAGAAFAGIGIFFAGLAGLAAQLAGTSRGATGLALAGLGLAFVVAGIGNILGRVDEAGVRVVSAWPAWLSPVGWGQQMRAFEEDHWSLLGLFAFSFLVLAAGAVFLETRRDTGKGLLPERRGPSAASPGLLSPVGLVWRLQRGVFLSWAVGVGLFGIVVGAVSADLEAMLDELEGFDEIFERIGGTDVIVDAAFVTFMGILALVITIYAVQGLLRMRAEESDGPAESVMATAVSRRQWVTSYILNIALGTAALFLIVGLTVGVTAGIVMGDVAAWAADLVVAGLVHIPAAWVVAGAVVLAFGLFPRRTALLAWMVFVIAAVTGPFIGAMLDLPEWIQNISPFIHVPAVPGESVTAAPIVGLLGMAVLLTGAGLLAFRRRDIDVTSV